MSQKAYQVELTDVDELGNEIPIHLINTTEEVGVGLIPEESGDLTLPGSSIDEILSTTLANIRRYLSNLSFVAQTQRKVMNDAEDNSPVNLATTQAVANVKAVVDQLSSDLSSNSTDLIKRAPIDHSSEDKTYGSATSEKFGHVKLSDSYEMEEEENASADDGIAASKKALADVFASLDAAKAAVNHAVADATYGLATNVNYGHVRLSDTYSVALEDEGLAASQKALADAYSELTNNTETGVASKAPISHASEDTIYGVGTSTEYGHVKISDDVDMENVETVGSAAAGMSASLYALAKAKAAIDTALETKAPATHAEDKATSETLGHVKLTDEYQANTAGADAGIAVSGKALTDAYNELLEAISSVKNNVITLNSSMVAENSHIEFRPDGVIVKTTASSNQKTSFPPNGNIHSVVEVKNEEGEVINVITNETIFNSDGSIDTKVTMTNDES